MVNKSIRYISVALLVAITILTATGFLNYLVDPLWFFGGNKILSRNFPFDERTARVARYVTSDRDYDCYIFGASRVSFMNERDFTGYRCFMVSFANATPRELIAYASYLRTRAKRTPRLVIVGVDDFDFIDQADALDLPAPVRDNKTPHFWQYYFSGDVLQWSLRTLFDVAPLPRYYGEDLTGKIRADAGSLPILRMELKAGQKWNMSFNSVSQYAKFRQIFPEAHLIAYATPVSATRIMLYEKIGLLPSYLRALHDTAIHFDEMFDFSIPSMITLDPHLTYDGSHYQPLVSDRIAAAIQSHNPDFGIELTARTLEQVSTLYAQRLDLARLH